MDIPRPSSSRRAASPRPRAHRKRSNSLPIVDALGCSTPEAELILAEGRAAVRSRRPSVVIRERRKRSRGDRTTFRPEDHILYLQQSEIEKGDSEGSDSTSIRNTRHARIPSNATIGSTSTVTGPAPAATDAGSPTSPNAQLGDYSSNLARFIQSQLDSIPTYKTFQSTVTSPRSCPDLSFPSGRPPLSPRSPRRPADMPSIIEIPSVRPPLKSAFSAWSSTDDEAEEDEVPPLPPVDPPRQNSQTSNDTPSVLGYYASAYSGTFLFPSTPLDTDEPGHSTSRGYSFPNWAPTSNTSIDSHSTSIEDEYVSSDVSAQPQLTASSVPSFSSASTASYFDYKRPIHLEPHVKDRVLAATAPHVHSHKVLTAISPFEGNAFSNVHDILVESHQRVVVEGMSFDLVRDLNLPDDSMRRIPTPC